MKYLLIQLLISITISIINGTPYLSALIKKRNDEDLIETTETNNNKCQMEINTQNVMTMKREVSTAYAGNGYSYEIGCSVIDPNFKLGDKYYVIDLIVYGPNTRVAKAWREQFTTTSISQTRSLVLNKSLSFHWLGVNNIVCSVSKYNNLVNKFTRVCQTNSNVNVVEKNFDDQQSQVVQQQNNMLKIASIHRQFWSTTSLLKTNSISQSTDENKRTTNDQLITFEKTNQNLLKNLNSNETKSFELTNHSSLINLNLSAKAMQYRDLNEVSDKKLIINSQMRQDVSTRHLIQPLTVVFIILVLFAIIIATLIYSTYHQKSSKQYLAVSVNGDKSKHINTDLDDDTNLDSIKIVDSKSSNESVNLKCSDSKDAYSIDEISSID